MSELAILLTSLVEKEIGESGSAPEVYGRLLQHTGLSNEELGAYLDGESELYTETDDDTILVVPADIRNFASFFDAKAGDLLTAALDDGLLTTGDERESDAPTIREVIPAKQYQRLLTLRAQLDEALDA